MAKVTGIPTLYQMTRLLCLAISKFRPLVYLYFPANNDLQDTLEAASIACSLFLAQLVSVRDYGD